ncbi:glycosyltransferase [Flavobacterium oreochromis]|uniref:glycosyltransferase n=1 Tax=Flavobacterium oreochromis TaxID=2906078 RepID=UPI00385C0B70
MKISVCMITYNHEKYIKQAIESVLMQVTDFDFELIISNDNSNDYTDKVINDLLTSHPKANRIKYIKNQQNLGMMLNFVQALQNCQGEYVALCEGDDYWTDPKKIQKQVDFLDKNPSFSICYHSVAIDEGTTISEDHITKKVNEHTTIHDLALGNYIHTCSVVYRNNLFVNFPDYFYYAPVGDYFIHLLNAQYGDIYHISEKMANYRIHNSSYWSSKADKERISIWIEFLEKITPLFNTEVQLILKKQIASHIKNKKKIALRERKKIILDNIKSVFLK